MLLTKINVTRVITQSPTRLYFILFHLILFFNREGEDWSRVRRALASKMLRPKDIRENLDNFNGVTRDTIEHLLTIRGEDGVVPDLENELAKYAFECKFCNKSDFATFFCFLTVVNYILLYLIEHYFRVYIASSKHEES